MGSMDPALPAKKMVGRTGTQPGYQLQAGEELAHAFEAAVEVMLGHRIRNARMLAGTKGLARNDRDVSFLEQLARHNGRRTQTLAAEVMAQIREYIKRPVGIGTGNARDGADSSHSFVAQVNVALTHPSYAVLGAVERSDGGFLHNRRRIRGALALQLVHGGDNGRGTENVAQAPSRHGVSFRQRADNQQSLFDVVDLA